MPQILVNATPQDFDISPETWGDLLHTLDERAARQGVILSAARFDGVEEPSFRDPSAIARPLRAVARVEVETAAPTALLRDCLLEAIPSLLQTAGSALRLATIYRGHDLTAGHEGLTTLAGELGSIAVLANMLDGPLAIDLNSWSIDGVTAARHLQQLGGTLDSLVAAQEAADWVTVADILEYDLDPAIRKLAALLTQLAGQLQ